MENAETTEDKIEKEIFITINTATGKFSIDSDYELGELKDIFLLLSMKIEGSDNAVVV